MNKSILGLLLIFLLISCNQEKAPLPFIGHTKVVDGKELHHKIPDFEFTNQSGKTVNNQVLSEYIYITDFFFTSCPSICPKVMKNMLTVYDEFKSHPKIKLVNHTIDPKRDTETHLKNYAKNLGVDQDKWWFLTGDKDELLDIADEYFVVAIEDPEAPGGFDHSGKIILVDTNGHVRAFCEGTDADDVKKFIPKVKQLLKEYE